MSKVAYDTETLRSSRGSRAGTDVGSVSRSSSHPAFSDRVFDFDESVANSPVYRRAQQQRVVPKLSLQTHFQSNMSRATHSPLTDEGYISNHTETSNLAVPSLGALPQKPRHLSMPNSPSTPVLPGHSRSISSSQSPSMSSPSIARQWQFDSQTLTQSTRPSGSIYEKLSAFLGRINTRSRVNLVALAQGGSPNSATSPTMSRGKRNLEADLSPSIDLTTMDAALVPLIVKAAQAGSRDEVERLIEHGCDVDECHGQSGRNALLVAAHCGHETVVDLLIRNHAQLAVVDESGATALHLAASRGHYAVLELLVVESGLVEATNFDGQTALRVAADRGQINAMEVLLRHNAKVNARAEKLMTALHAAAKRGDAEITQLLISHGADLEAKDGTMMTALHYACDAGHREVIGLLLDCRAQIESPGPAKKTPLICAAEAGMTHAVDLLLKRRASPRNTDDAGMTALHWAAYNGHDEIIKILSQKKGSLFSGNNAGQTPLHLATLRSQFSVVELLLRKNVPIDSRCNRGLTALHYACDTDSFEIANLLLLTGADIEASKYEDRQRPLHIAAARNASCLLDLLCDQRAMLDARDGLGDRPLCVASRYGHVAAAQRLLERGSPLYCRFENSSREDSPLCLAAKGGHFSVASFLLEQGASSLRKDETGWQPFRYAAYYGHPDVLQLLLSYSNVPVVDIPDIMAMPETVGFAPDADISDERKRQVQLLLEQAFEHLSPGRSIARSRPSPTTGQHPTAINVERLPAYGGPTVNLCGPHELPQYGSSTYRRSELPGSQIMSQEQQQVHPLGPGASVGADFHTEAREERRCHDSAVPLNADQIARLLSTHDIIEESSTWPGPRMRGQSREPSHSQVREELSESSTWPRFAAPRLRTPVVRPLASPSTTLPRKRADVSMTPTSASMPKIREESVRATDPLSINKSRIPRLRLRPQLKINTSFTSTPHPDSGSESDSSVYTAPEIQVDPDTYMSLNVRNGLYELE